MFSEGRVEPASLFRPLLRRCRAGSKTLFLVFVLDDSQMPNAGKRIPDCRPLRDPHSPHYHLNLHWAQRFVQISVLVPSDGAIGSAPAIPVALRVTPSARKRGARAGEAERAAYRVAQRE